MRGIKDSLGAKRDANGTLIIGNPNGNGCRHCGTLKATPSSDGMTIIYHPALECCEPALRDQIRHRNDEIRARQRDISNMQARLKQLEETAESYGTMRSTQAAEARQKLERAQRGIGDQIAALAGNFSQLNDTDIAGLNLVGIRQLKTEISRLEQKISWLRTEDEKVIRLD